MHEHEPSARDDTRLSAHDAPAGTPQQRLGTELLRAGRTELLRARATRGASRRTARRVARAMAALALASSLLGFSTAASVAEASHTITCPRQPGPHPMVFVNPNPLPLGGALAVGDVAVGDLDGDGDLDVLAHGYTASSPTSVLFIENTGTATGGAFAAAVAHPFGIVSDLTGPPHEATLELADIDGDGDLDLFFGKLPDVGSESPLYFQENTGSTSAPAFAPAVDAGVSPLGLDFDFHIRPDASFADIDGDGDLDAFVTELDDNAGAFGIVSPVLFFENTGGPSSPAFTSSPRVNPMNLRSAPGNDSSPAVVDADGDGDLDLFVATTFSDDQYVGIRFFENLGSSCLPAFGDPQTVPFGLNLPVPSCCDEPRIEFADLDGDGDLDALVPGFSNSGVLIFVNQAGPPPVPPQSCPVAPAPTPTPAPGSCPPAIIPGEIAFETPVELPLGGATYVYAKDVTIGDLDGDGDLDFIVMGRVSTDWTALFLENTGTPNEPALAFPVEHPFGLVADLSWRATLDLVDIDGDGDLDLFFGRWSAEGLYFQENTGSAASPAFAPPKDAWHPPLYLGLYGRFNGLEDVNFADIDGDGDFDAFVSDEGFFENGTHYVDTLFFENTGTAQAPAFAYKVNAGYHYSPHSNPMNLVRAPTFPESYYDAWNTSPTTVDIDGDGDLDFIDGVAYSYPERARFRFFENTGASCLASFDAPVQEPFFGISNPGQYGEPDDWLNADFADIDGDGDLDMIATSEFWDNPENNRNSDSIAWIENVSRPALPRLFDVPEVNPFGLANVGDENSTDPDCNGNCRPEASPEFGDIDGDGDLDAFVGNVLFERVLEPGCQFFCQYVTYVTGHIRFFENTGSATAAAFAAQVEDPFGLVAVSDHAKPAFGDIDGDGDLDLFVGEGDSFDLVFFENTGSAAAPAFAAPVVNPFGLTGTGVYGNYTAPELVDIDGDADLDVFVGTARGDTVFFENTGTAIAPAFAPRVDAPFGISDVGSQATPAFTDIDGDGDLDLFVGQLGGSPSFFENVGTATAPAFKSQVQDAFGLEPINFSLPLASRRAPDFADIDGDGDEDALVGMTDGDVQLLENVSCPPASTCGNGVVEVGEDCDDGNVLNGDCCSSTCQNDPVGGACDDGNVCTSNDTCVQTGPTTLECQGGTCDGETSPGAGDGKVCGAVCGSPIRCQESPEGCTCGG